MESKQNIREAVRENYGKIAEAGGRTVGNGAQEESEEAGGCCGPSAAMVQTAEAKAKKLGYGDEELGQVPEGANLGLGCGNPTAIAALRPGETVVDLGSGGGFDCFLASPKVGPAGRVIGVDMTASMVERARENAAKGDFGNVEFRLGEIEHLPVGDDTVDVIISNCVINLSPDKPAVYADAFRVLKPGGRLAISDVVASAPLPQEVREDLALVTACVGGAETVADQEEMLRQAGFADVSIRPKAESREFIRDWVPGSKAEDYVVSAIIEATKPAS